MYEIGRRIGKGSFGKVHLAVHKLSGLKVAIKTIDKVHIKEDRARRKILQEVIAMRQVDSPNVAQLFEMFESSRHLMLVIEYAGGGDMLQMMKTRGRLPESEAKLIFRQVVQAVKDCHAAYIVHRDVKLDNILLTEGLDCAKLCDFGVSKTWRKGQLMTDQCGTPAYIAPEIIADNGYEGPYVDIWSLGVVLYIMINGTIPFKAKTLPDLQKLILRGKMSIPKCVSADAHDLIKGMLRLVPSQRLSLEEVLSHQWFYSEQEETSVYEDLLPRFEGQTSPKLQSKELNSEVLSQMEDLGFPADAVVNSLKANEVNHATATYRLLTSVL
jgi:serine/threonine protein kinase